MPELPFGWDLSGEQQQEKSGRSRQAPKDPPSHHREWLLLDKAAGEHPAVYYGPRTARRTGDINLKTKPPVLPEDPEIFL